MILHSIVDLMANSPIDVLAQDPPSGDYTAPDPGPRLPEEVQEVVNEWIGYLKGAAVVAAVIGFVCSGIMMMVGMRSRSDLAKTAMTHLPWVAGGTGVVALSAVLVNQIW